MGLYGAGDPDGLMWASSNWGALLTWGGLADIRAIVIPSVI